MSGSGWQNIGDIPDYEVIVLVIDQGWDAAVRIELQVLGALLLCP